MGVALRCFSNMSLLHRSHSLYRRCDEGGDAEAKQLYYQWMHEGSVDNPLISFDIKDPGECLPAVWKEVACAVATKPCHPDTHTSLICRWVESQLNTPTESLYVKENPAMFGMREEIRAVAGSCKLGHILLGQGDQVTVRFVANRA